MAQILEYLAVISLWLVVASVVVFVDPELVRNMIIPGIYLPMLVLCWWVIAYTLSVFVNRKLYVYGLSTFLILILAILLSI